MRRVVVTGLGVISSIGNNKSEVVQVHRKDSKTGFVSPVVRSVAGRSIGIQKSEGGFTVDRQGGRQIQLLRSPRDGDRA